MHDQCSFDRHRLGLVIVEENSAPETTSGSPSGLHDRIRRPGDSEFHRIGIRFWFLAVLANERQVVDKGTLLRTWFLRKQAVVRTSNTADARRCDEGSGGGGEKTSIESHVFCPSKQRIELEGNFGGRRQGF